MLYSLLIAIIILSGVTPLIAIWCFIKGYNTIAREVAQKPIIVKKPSVKRRKAPTGDKNAEILLANIEAYDGTSNGQRDFE